MAVPATEFDEDTFVEERIARLEEKTDHIQSDITDIKADIRRIDAKIDNKIDPKIDAVKDSVAALRVETKESIAALEGRMRDSFADLEARMRNSFADLEARMRNSFAAVDASFAKINVDRMKDRVWWLLMAGAILGVLARGFKWI